MSHQWLVSVPLVDLCQEKEKLSCFHPYTASASMQVWKAIDLFIHLGRERKGVTKSWLHFKCPKASSRTLLVVANNGGSRTASSSFKKGREKKSRFPFQLGKYLGKSWEFFMILAINLKRKVILPPSQIMEGSNHSKPVGPHGTGFRVRQCDN